MVKKLSAVALRFTKAETEKRAVARSARTTESVERQRTLDCSVIPPDMLAPMPANTGFKVVEVELDNRVIALVSRSEQSASVHVLFLDDAGTQVSIQNIDACKPILTFRKIAACYLLPNGLVKLVKLVQQRDAEAEAEQLRAVTAQPTSTVVHDQVRL